MLRLNVRVIICVLVLAYILGFVYIRIEFRLKHPEIKLVVFQDSTLGKVLWFAYYPITYIDWKYLKTDYAINENGVYDIEPFGHRPYSEDSVGL